jgi:hypothetical protein
MIAATGVSYPDRPETEIRDLRKGSISDIKNLDALGSASSMMIMEIALVKAVVMYLSL